MPTDICACANQIAKRREKIQPVAVPLDKLSERCTMTMHPEISARGSLRPAGDGSSLFVWIDSMVLSLGDTASGI